MTTKEIAEKTGWSYFTCYRWASEKGDVKKDEFGFNWTDDDLQNFINRESQKNWKPEEIEAVKKYLSEGMALITIAGKIKKSRDAICKMIVKKNIMTEEELKARLIENQNKVLAKGREKLKNLKR